MPRPNLLDPKTWQSAAGSGSVPPGPAGEGGTFQAGTPRDHSNSGFVMPFSFPGAAGSAPQTLGPLIFPARENQMESAGLLDMFNPRELSPIERRHEGEHAAEGPFQPHSAVYQHDLESGLDMTNEERSATVQQAYPGAPPTPTRLPMVKTPQQNVDGTVSTLLAPPRQPQQPRMGGPIRQPQPMGTTSDEGHSNYTEDNSGAYPESDVVDILPTGRPMNDLISPTPQPLRPTQYVTPPRTPALTPTQQRQGTTMTNESNAANSFFQNGLGSRGGFSPMHGDNWWEDPWGGGL